MTAMLAEKRAGGVRLLSCAICQPQLLTVMGAFVAKGEQPINNIGVTCM